MMRAIEMLTMIELSDSELERVFQLISYRFMDGKKETASSW
jgi:hypothetical protein